MRANEFIIENVTRRTALGALAGLATSATAQTSTRLSPYQDLTWLEFPYERVAKENLAGRKVSENEYWEWKLREHRLRLRIERIVNRLASVDSNRAKWRGVIDVVVSLRSPGSGGYAHNAKQLRVGLSQNWNMSDDSLAYLIAHEIGHAVYGHQPSDQLPNSVVSRQQEIEADVYGAKLAASAGYKPQRMYDSLGRGDSESRTHPSYNDRRRSVRDRTGIPVAVKQNSTNVTENNSANIKNHLVIFDIDDTLLHTTAQIAVVKDGKLVRRLSNQQFNDYQLRPGEQFDFREFRDSIKFNRESTPIGRMIGKLKFKMSDPRNHVIFLTARSDFDDKNLFLQTFKDLGIDMSQIHVHRAGNLPGDEAPAYKKAIWVRRYLDTNRYDSVALYDDSNQNLRVFKSLQREYPRIVFHAYHVGGSGRTRAVESKLTEMPMVQQGTLGSLGSESPFSQRNQRLIASSGAARLRQSYFRNTPFNFRIFFCNYPDTERQKLNNGILSTQMINNFFTPNDSATILQGTDNAITLIIWPSRRVESQIGNGVHVMSPHIVAHYVGHAVEKEVNYIDEYVKNILSETFKQGYYGHNLVRNVIVNAIGTTGSARKNQIRNSTEFVFECLAQYINRGVVTLKTFPKVIPGVLDSSGYMAQDWYREELTQKLSDYLNTEFAKVLKSLTGKVYMMKDQ